MPRSLNTARKWHGQLDKRPILFSFILRLRDCISTFYWNEYDGINAFFYSSSSLLSRWYHCPVLRKFALLSFFTLVYLHLVPIFKAHLKYSTKAYRDIMRHALFMPCLKIPLYLLIAFIVYYMRVDCKFHWWAFLFFISYSWDGSNIALLTYSFIMMRGQFHFS